MSNTYTQIHLHLVFTVQNRLSLIDESWSERLYQYISGIVRKNTHKTIAINGMPDHVHLVIGMRPVQSLSDLMQDIKMQSSKWINENKLVPGKFRWQEGYGAFSYNKSSLPNLIRYVNNQKEHHRKKTFLEEYRAFLEAFAVDYDEQYIFKPVE
ncbi:MAG: IS200/IS605 family transposase [Bacteroidetes bacterium]|nr:IS200/IS605 family transposase [Bacteroidota bacterium]